ncbi:hypothetical protein O0I10_008491 [Lichtheimia ornata]|uniref:Integral membrane protein n=1 Tax=Lichtheimia ornata TaxID=688661 RepID=A0AAD7UYK0_9FUNG|nr:uncharacterized protein O0I10_008491 [Lichtheimia ornata]KAJ8655827.1 hypothetical protein O0I10_008491 [Lichtheimia ornata]
MSSNEPFPFLAISIGWLAAHNCCWASSNDYFTTECSGVWSKGSIPGGQDAFIKVDFADSSQGKTALLVYEWQDFDLVGRTLGNDTVGGRKKVVCDEEAITQRLCNASSYGEFLVSSGDSHSSIFTTAIHLNKSEESALYKVDNTGYYCVSILPANRDNESISTFDATIEWRNPYGNLPAGDYPKLLFYGIFSLIYLAVGLFWGIQSFRYWSDILPVQHFLSGTIFFLIVEMAINWGFWEAYNQTGSPSYGLLALVALTSAGRNSMSFFMLLVVCMGYSVVKPSLGATMKKCVVLACTHFFFGVVYSLGVMLLDPETAGFLVLLVIFPLAITMSAFYVWIFSSLGATINTLEIRKQHVKALMYTRLYRLLIFSVLMVVLIFVINMFAFSGSSEVDWDANSWQWRWIMLDGSLNLLYFVVFFVIIILWRPTSNNQRYGLQQISQDEDEAMDLEDQLRRAGGSRGLNDDEAAIFEVGDDDLSDDGHDKVKLVSVPARQSTETRSSPPSYAAATSSSTPQHQAPSTPNHRGESEGNALLQEEDDDEPDDDERAHLTKNARK